MEFVPAKFFELDPCWDIRFFICHAIDDDRLNQIRTLHSSLLYSKKRFPKDANNLINGSGGLSNRRLRTHGPCFLPVLFFQNDFNPLHEFAEIKGFQEKI